MKHMLSSRTCTLKRLLAERRVGQTSGLIHELAELAAVNGLWLVSGAMADAC
jgi:hypothetical protein